ncbi:hypothetical protein D9613_002768 [Agrocybe pediades]|uniref:Uncharacterized protein n=1 Tax=Agrocybe pediades TaxID=84607 RepID=A0A8H4QQH5_9AGAR|nr:hypothetical protein D9613_002768 [Agrocybe pediades]
MMLLKHWKLASWRELLDKIPPNPVTGKVEMMDVLKFVESHPDKMEKFMAQSAESERGKPKVDLANYDYQALASTIVPSSFWVIQLTHVGFFDRNGNEVDPAQAHSSSGIEPAFMIYCYDEKNMYRLAEQCLGLPDSTRVLKSIKQAIADPVPPLKPSLPLFLIVSIKFAAHAEVLKPFLDSLPAPFHWRFETAQEAEIVDDGVHELNKKGVKIGMELAEKEKASGNKAFAKKDRKAAIEAYSAAVGHTTDVLSQKPDIKEQEKATKLRAVCLANRAAAQLLPGDDMNAKSALEDGKAAETLDPSYAKAYARQAAASEALGNITEAQDAIARALRRKDLENDSALVDRFLSLLVGGDVAPLNGTALRQWFEADSSRKERIKDIGGELKRRLEAL